MQMKKVQIGNFTVSNDQRFALFAGPCQMESMDHALDIAGQLSELCKELGINFIYKSSFDKANRSSLNAKRGLGLEKSLQVFEKIKATYGCPVVTDIHEKEQCQEMAEVVDVLQIPAFLCRQTDLLVAAAQTGKVIKVKKGQFLAPWDIANIAEKIAASGNENILFTDRGTCFGYNRLITDMRGLKIMGTVTSGRPVVFDATHSVQEPGGLGGASGGQREFVRLLSRAAVAVGIAGLFIETHQDPDNAPSDGPCMLKLSSMRSLLSELIALDDIAKKYSIYNDENYS